MRITLAATILVMLSCLNSGCHLHLHYHTGGRQPETVVEITDPGELTPETILEVFSDGRPEETAERK